MRIVTWNVNSIRARRERALAWVTQHQPDVIALQELKTTDEAFPTDDFAALGYHAVTWGQKTYNGVALLSRTQPTDVVRGFDDGVDDPQARFIAATFEGVRVCCGYFPNGGEPDSDKYQYKRAWLGRLDAWLDDHASADEALVLCGDFNIAPDASDVCNVNAWEGTVLFNPEMRAAFRGLLDWGLTDSFRLQDDHDVVFSWWDYRRLAFVRNQGLRIDHLLVTAPLVARVERVWVDRAERKGESPSDHAPVVLDMRWP